MEFEWKEVWNEEQPTEEGWYAVACCWDPEEGTCTYASYWDGDGWNPNYPVNRFAGPFETEKKADKWASDHDYF